MRVQTHCFIHILDSVSLPQHSFERLRSLLDNRLRKDAQYKQLHSDILQAWNTTWISLRWPCGAIASIHTCSRALCSFLLARRTLQVSQCAEEWTEVAQVGAPMSYFERVWYQQVMFVYNVLAVCSLDANFQNLSVWVWGQPLDPRFGSLEGKTFGKFGCFTWEQTNSFEEKSPPPSFSWLVEFFSVAEW